MKIGFYLYNCINDIMNGKVNIDDILWIGINNQHNAIDDIPGKYWLPEKQYQVKTIIDQLKIQGKLVTALNKRKPNDYGLEDGVAWFEVIPEPKNEYMAEQLNEYVVLNKLFE
jgi:hypothetical protein